MRVVKIILYVYMLIITISNSLAAVDNRAFRDKIDRAVKHPGMQAYLDTIAYAEGTFHKDGYQTLFGGNLFYCFKDHPRKVIGKKSCDIFLSSTAAGRYQVLSRIWDAIAKDLKLENFSPANQDRCAVYLIRQMGALRHVLSGDFKEAIKKTAPVWASLPGSRYKQPMLPFRDLEKFYLSRLYYYKYIIKKV